MAGPRDRSVPRRSASRSRRAARVALALLPALAATAQGGPPACPKGMARIAGRPGCIDRYEATLGEGATGGPDGRGTTVRALSRPGAPPSARISQKQAAAACANAGKRLCTRAEWTAACRGGAGRRYPYGDRYEAARCHDRALALRRGSRAPLPTGSLARCRTPEGVFDLSGNVWEWIAETNSDGTTAAYLGGGYGNDAEDGNLSCEPEEPTGQPVTQQIEGLGFRCCADLVQ